MLEVTGPRLSTVIVEPCTMSWSHRYIYTAGYLKEDPVSEKVSSDYNANTKLPHL